MYIPELVTLLIMAMAVSVDAFSVSLGLGTYKFRLRQIIYIGLIVGLFHVLMPLAGIFMGHMLAHIFGIITTYIGGILLITLGVQMIYFCFRNDEKSVGSPIGFGLLFFSLILSLDSFSAGLSLGMFGVRAVIAVTCFGIVATILTWTGLILGRKATFLTGTYGEIFGGIILITFGLKLLWPI